MRFSTTVLGTVVGGLALLAVPAWTFAGVGEGGLSTDWVEGHASRVRIVAGRGGVRQGDGAGSVLAGVEIDLQPGWKTYWISPGDAGGVPPDFDWSKSTNLGTAKVLYPVPKRFTDDMGETIGYKESVVLPVVVTVQDAAKPVELNVDVAFGVCRDICIPAEAQLSLLVPPGGSHPVPEEVIAALEKVPRSQEDKKPGDPELVSYDVALTGEKPQIVLDVDFGAGPEAGDVFAIAPHGLYLPTARRLEAVKDASNRSIRYVIDLTATSDLPELKGKTIRVILAGAKGQSERELRLE
jgi:DsbC/DsbD-like thiol-disulfide interchange protein